MKIRYCNPRRGAWLVVPTVLLLSGCGADDVPTSVAEQEFECSIPSNLIFSAAPGKDGIPALFDPFMVSSSDVEASYLSEDDRVIGLVAGGEAIAIPLNILWWHEIVNLEFGGRSLAITHCPLTGSSMAFDRGPLGGVGFGISGLLYNNNLVMYDRTTDESLWPQMSRGARCGSQDGTSLTMIPVIETTWGRWLAFEPETTVISSETGYSRDYFGATGYPYGNYDHVDNPLTLFPMEIDRRRPPKERVLGVPGINGDGVAFAFGELGLLGSFGVVEPDPAGSSVPEGTVLFWEENSETAALYRPRANGIDLTFEVSGPRIVDLETGSWWRVDGVAIDGPLAGQRLDAVAEAYVAYWFAWAAFEPNTTIWTAS